MSHSLLTGNTLNIVSSEKGALSMTSILVYFCVRNNMFKQWK